MSEIRDRFESLISAWLDDELERSETTEMLDHLVRCGGCRSFYRDARALEGVIITDSTDLSASPPASTAVWQRIEKETKPVPRRRFGGWALRAAAVAVVGLALAFVVAPRVDLGVEVSPVVSDQGEIEVELGSRRGEMTEDRFLEIATEVLEADRRYQRAMLQVMDRVMEDQPATEGGGDALAHRGERERTGEGAGGRA